MNDRQRHAYEHPQLRSNPFSTTREHVRLEPIAGLNVESTVSLKGTSDGEPPAWWVSVAARQEGGNLYRLEHLSAEQRLALRRHAYSLLQGVGIDPPTLIACRWSYELTKDCSAEEVAGLPAEATAAPVFKVKVVR